MANRARERAWLRKTKGLTASALESLVKGILLSKLRPKVGGKTERKKRERVFVYEILRITPGKRHAWVRTNIGILKKPLGEFIVGGYAK